MDIRCHNHLGDVLEAIRFLQEHGLEEDDEERRGVAELLGFQWRAEPRRAPRSAPTLGPNPDPPPINDLDEVEQTPAPVQSDNDAWVERHAATASESLEWYSQIKALPATSSAADLPELPLVPLFNPGWTRAILFAALAWEIHDGDLDVDRLAESLASGQPVRELPRLPRERLGQQRFQVLVDIREAMRPFRRDQQEILSRVEAFLPRESVEFVTYFGCPLKARNWAVPQEDFTYRIPPAGTVVFLLTDLGLGPRVPGTTITTPGDWERFALRLWRAGCSVKALVPYASRRLPARLRRRIAVFPWRRETTSGQVARLRKRVERSQQR